MPLEQTNTDRNKRIARNTIYLYFRTILIMLITLYTSRVILNTLGVEDYGIYNTIGGTVSMFTILTGALSAAISRYITFELGKKQNTKERLRVIFSTSIRIQLFLSFIIIVLGETIGLWFLNTHLNIPAERMIAANWVWQCCLFSFIVGLISVPYNALIIAHEQMNAYAFISILDVTLRLGICYLLIISPWDKLSTYSVLLVAVAATIQLTYAIYSKKHFSECKFVKEKDDKLTKEMLGFAGFSFLNNAANIFNSQGLNLLINIFFGVIFNAARGVATQVESAILQLVNNLTVAVNPQITKAYASGDYSRVYSLVCRGTKYAYFLLLLFAIPVFIETDFILQKWLKIVPNNTCLFLRLSLIGGMIKMLGNTGYTACMATGKIKSYSIWITSVGIMAFPLTWVSFEFGAPAEFAYYIFIGIYIAVEIVRLILMKRMIGFPIKMFVYEVVCKVIYVTPIAVALPFFLSQNMEMGWIRLIVMLLVSTVSTLATIWFVGMCYEERQYLAGIIKNKIHRTK